MTSGFAPALLPLKRYAEFGGRSTRTELALFYVLVFALNAGLSFVGDMIGHRADQWLSQLLTLALACPTLALLVRRMHDSGRSGWWLLLGLPALGVALWHAWLKLHDPYAMSPLDDFLALNLAGGICTLVLLILLLWDDEEGPNLYGPNPRYGDAEAAG